jgi:arylsulfatase A-like enzyme
VSSSWQATIGRTIEQSTPWWPEPSVPGAAAPNILLVVLDDVGFAQFGCFGGDIETPHIDRVAAEGLRYTSFHATSLCSPTRASLLTGRNPHSVGFGTIVERASGFPGYNARIPPSAATIAGVLRHAGYSTWAAGKWHLTPSYEAGPAGPFDRWPLGLGFERYFGFMGGSTDQYSPILHRDNTRVPAPDRPPDGYHLNVDLADTAIGWIREQCAVAPEKPFFLYYATGAGHAPHQAPAEWTERYRGRFDRGWDRSREEIFERQRAMGMFAGDARMAPANPGVQPWADLSVDEQRLFARMMEVYAGFLSHTDHQLGRVFDFLDQANLSERTVVVVMSDNGASADGGPAGTLSEGLLHNDLPQTLSDALPMLGSLGGPNHYNNYPWGWAQAGNTPFKWYKSFTHAGGIRVPLVIRAPGTIADPGATRAQYHHCSDVMPTILDLAGVAHPREVGGVTQQPIEGVSMINSLADPVSPSPKVVQHYEVYGNRALWKDGFTAVCRLQADAPGAWPSAEVSPLEELSWEMYDTVTDPGETVDLADERRPHLDAMVEDWWREAEAHGVLPLDTRARAERWALQPQPTGNATGRFEFFGPCGPFERGVSPKLLGSSFRLTADVEATSVTRGVLFALGSRHGGYVWYVLDGRMAFVSNLMVVQHRVEVPLELLAGPHELTVDFVAAGDFSGHLTFGVDGEEIGGGRLERVLRVHPLGCPGVQIGGDVAPTVSDRYEPPFPFSGAIKRLVVEVLDESPPVGEGEAELHAQ